MGATAKSARRTASRKQRRQQLIVATIKCIARKGMGGTSIGDVAKEAGLSQGIVNPVSYTHLTLPTIQHWCRSRWSAEH